MSANLTARSSSDMGSASITIKSSKRPSNRFPFYPPTEIIPGECEILHEDENGNKTTRLIRYVSGMKSVFVDEWSDKERSLKPKKIKLTNGFKQISTRDQNLYNFVKLSGYNSANDDSRMPGTSVLYEVLDYEQKAKEAVTQRNRTIEAEHFVANAPLEDVRSYALALCKSKSEADSLAKDTEFTVRHRLMAVAKSNPETFIDGLQSKALKNKIIIHKALQEGIILLTPDSSAMFFDGGEEFVKAPSGMSVIDWFADLSIKNADYTSILDSIKEKVSTPEKSKENTSWEDQLLEKALKSGSIVKSNNWYAVVNKDDEENPLMKFNGKTAVLKAIGQNKDFILTHIV
jgi:hypothetical protein